MNKSTAMKLFLFKSMTTATVIYKGHAFCFENNM